MRPILLSPCAVLASADLSIGVAYSGQIDTRIQDHAVTGNLT